jgi:polysaccharide biosynthesis/export protein
MRGCRLLLVLVAALAAAGCLRQGPAIQYVAYGPAAMAQAAGSPAPLRTYQPLPPSEALAYRARAQSAAAPGNRMAAAPAPRGLFSRPDSYRAPAYREPGEDTSCIAQTCTPAYAPRAPQPALQAKAGLPAYAAAAAPQARPRASTAYKLDAGDRLRITVFGQAGLSNSYIVDAAGTITMPLVGAVPARGLTTDQLGRAVAERLRQGYIREPQVAIEIEAYRPFFIYGEVTAPGQYPYLANMTVENAIAVAGGFGPRADQNKIALSRTVGGETMRFAVGLHDPLRPGDTLRIGERWF